MEPIAETLEALDELDPFVDDASLHETLRHAAALSQSIAPDVVGVSIASREHGITFTLVATDEQIAALDGVQYLTSGPCVEAMDAGRGVATTSDDLLSEPGWLAFGLASAAAGVRSTLTFPILSQGQVIGTVNMYGRSKDAFDGKHEALAAVFRAWAPGAVSNADLSFSTRRLAEQAPELLRDRALIDAATGILAAAHDLPMDAARESLREAAEKAGVSEAKLAQTVISLNHPGST